MPAIRRSTFLIGFLIGALIAAIVWYYQKSTSAEDGALDLLDRLAKTQARVRDLETPSLTSEAPDPPRAAPTEVSPVEDDLQQIAGIGPSFSQRLRQAGITTFAALSALTPDQLHAVVGARPNVEDWIADAKSRVG